MFSFVSIAKPGKHFLIETDEEDGQLENGSVPNKNVEFILCYKILLISAMKVLLDFSPYFGK